ncbi:MAG: hypothetical protein MZV49_17060 [Rhodopseudomonas palustris]|nr:hypothetical protein [Rhodopseudomonas palustris]
MVEASDPVGVLRLSEQAEFAEAEWLPGAPADRAWRATRWRRWRRWLACSAPSRTPRGRSRRCASDAAERCADAATAIAMAIARAIPDNGDRRSTRSITTGRGFFPPTAAARAARLAAEHGRLDRLLACRSRPARRSPARTAR